MSINNNSKIYDILIHIGCGATPKIEEYRALAKQIWLIDADSQAVAILQEENQTIEDVNILYALVDTEKRTGTFYRYSLGWANSLTPVDESIFRLYPGLKSLENQQQLTTPIDEIIKQCLLRGPSVSSILLLDVGEQNDNLLQAMEEKGVVGLLELVLVLPAHRSVQPVNVPPGLHIRATTPTGLSLPRNTYVLKRHPLLQELQHYKAQVKKFKKTLEQNQEKLTERDKQLADCIKQRDEEKQKVNVLVKELDLIKEQVEKKMYQTEEQLYLMKKILIEEKE
ncbi:hypothetical protein [Vreelandella neptunia]|uniref:Uncharacterized protein n=1 Tax=Vreelandella neptunia TaxID=115551 RepID=A0ABS9S1N1_9GAMM|nr:hypothetical protein [Halomonas neptunia]MCH4810006.1 hypothetical protein [Halomonas neptunia]